MAERVRWPLLDEPEALAAALAAMSVRRLAGELGCSEAHVYSRAKACGIRFEHRRGPSIKAPGEAGGRRYEPANGAERLEAERRRAARAARSRDQRRVVQTPWGPRRLLKLGTGQLAENLEDQARRRAEQLLAATPCWGPTSDLLEGDDADGDDSGPV